MVIAIILGILAGAAAFLPLWGGLQMSKRVTKTSNLSHATTLLLSVFGSFVVLFGAMVVCILVARDVLVPFAAGEAGAIIVSAIAFGIKKNLRK